MNKSIIFYYFLKSLTLLKMTCIPPISLGISSFTKIPFQIIFYMFLQALPNSKNATLNRCNLGLAVTRFDARLLRIGKTITSLLMNNFDGDNDSFCSSYF